MLESEDESEGRENIVSNVDLSLVNVDRWTWFPVPGQRIRRQGEEISSSYLEQDILNQQHRIPVRNVVLGVSGRDGKREHAVPQEL